MDILVWIGIAVGVLVAILVVIALYGCLLPRGHRVARTLLVQQPVPTVWEVITDFANAPSWHKDLLRVERLPDRNGHQIWREVYQGNYPMQLAITTFVPPHQLTRTIADENGPFSGRWEFVLQAEGEGCRVTITEIGEVPNPFFRFMFRMFMNPAYYLEQYLKALAGRFNVPATVEAR